MLFIPVHRSTALFSGKVPNTPVLALRIYFYASRPFEDVFAAYVATGQSGECASGTEWRVCTHGMKWKSVPMGQGRKVRSWGGLESTPTGKIGKFAHRVDRRVHPQGRLESTSMGQIGECAQGLD